MTTVYKGSHYPGAQGVVGVTDGANCQQFAFALLRNFDCEIPDFRSSELWMDTTWTSPVQGSPFVPLDLLLWHSQPNSWGAHVGVYVGDERAVHLSQEVGRPVIWPLHAFLEHPRYSCFLGAKRPIVKRPNA